MKVVFVLPTLNEESTIGPQIKQLRLISHSCGFDAYWIVVDDSVDSTAAVAQAAGARVVKGRGFGLGDAVAIGLSEALALKPDWIVTMDTDGQADPAEIPHFFSAAEKYSADVVTSSRFLGQEIEYPYPLVNWLGNRILVGFLRLATGQAFTDSHGGIRLMNPRFVKGLLLLGRHTYVQETLIQFHRRGAIIKEIPSRWRPREAGGSRVLRSISRYVVRTLPALLYWMHFQYVAAALAFLFALAHAADAEIPMASILSYICAAMAFWLYTLPWRALKVTDGR